MFALVMKPRSLVSKPGAPRVATPARQLTSVAAEFAPVHFTRVPSARLQRHARLGSPLDPLEREADAVADRVMGMAGSHASPASALISPVQVQRKCKSCDEESQNVVRRRHLTAAGPESATAVHAAVHAAQSGGEALPHATRQFFEPRFGHDFGQVRIHTGAAAGAAARAVNAEAFTVGRDIVFAPGAFEPHHRRGQRLLAHELAHVVQQGGASSEPVIQRRLVVDPAAVVPPGPRTLVGAVQGLMNDMCPTGGFTVDATTGVVGPRPIFCEHHPPLLPGETEATQSPTPVGCQCLCDVVSNAQTTTVAFAAGGPTTGPGSLPGANEPGQGGNRTNARVQVDPRFQGQYLINGRWVDVPFHLLFAHELCGHALPKMQGTHVPRGAGPANGTPPQERHAVDVERAIAAERNLPRRPEDYSGAARRRP
jgi:Domain of unknown function (DUF4157)